MAHSTAHLAAVVILITVTSAKAQSRWSRQISSYTADISDWVPLSGPVERELPLPPIKRQAVAEPRILSDSFRPGYDSLPFRAYYNSPANKQLYLHSVPSVPSAPQNYLTEQGFGQSVRFGLQQPSFPLSQGFINTQFPHENLPQSIPQLKQRPQQIKMETFSKLPSIPQSIPSTMPMKYNQVSVLKPFAVQSKKPDAKFVDGYRAENSSNDYYKKPQSLQKIKFENYDKPKVEQQSRPKVEREEVQLLYVPVESLNRGQFNFRSPLTNTQLMDVDTIYNQGPQKTIKTQETAQTQKPINNFSGQNYFANFNSQLKQIDQIPKFSTLSSPFPTLPPVTPVTLKPKKLKPHQPPLAIFLTEENGNRQVKVGDVLNSLKHASSVPVLDSVNPLNAPKVFIGPSSLQPLDNYVKFELPYLSNIENSDKKLRQLPFFVAPLSYNTPQGFAKIPFPSPHVGSVVINSQIKESKPEEHMQPNYYTGTYRQEHKPVAAPQAPVTYKPTVNYYTAAPNVNNHNIPSNYYSFEPQTVSTLKPLESTQENILPVRPDAYFSSVKNGKNQNNPSNYYSFQPDTASTLKPLENSQDNIPPIRPGSYYDSQYNFASQNSYQIPEAPKTTYVPRKETTTTQNTNTPTTKPPTTYPSQLLETHNPYSINQAFHFSTPLDYHTYYDDHKEQKPATTPGSATTSTQAPLKLSSTTAKVDEFTKKTTYQQTPSYIQSYSPEIHYESDEQNKYTTYNNEYITKVESAETYIPNKNDNNAEVSPPQYTGSQETYPPVSETGNEEITPTVYEGGQQSYEYNQFQTTSEDEIKTTSTTTTTRRPIRQRTRTRYTTTLRPDSSEYSTRAVTRRPLRERRPLPTKRYELNKITTEKATRKPIDYSSSETTTKSTRTRNRGRVTFRPTDNEQLEKTKLHEKKDHDLAYQRDILHQNYPVTIQERMSTVDIEAMTEPSPKISTKNAEYVTETIDTENAYTNEKIQSVNPFNSEAGSDEDIPVYPAKSPFTQPDSESTYVPRLSTDEQFYQPKSSVAPESYETVSSDEKEDIYAKQTTARKEEPIYATESITLSEANGPSYAISNEYLKDETTTTEPEITTVVSVEEEENIVQTTPSYNRVRVRPGVVRQYHQASSESPRVKVDRRRPVTYRPAFDKRRTTMRIDEIEADLKTKQVHGHHENEYKHPVYKPEPTTEASTQETSTKRGAYRRRRPSYTYTTTTTDASDRSTIRNKYEVKNRFRGRRTTTEKPTDKPEVQAEVTTIRNLHSRYSHRPRLSERYNKKQEQEETEDQEPNYSYNRPKYTEPDTDIWSDNSFKPYNPNNILDEQFPTTERRSDRGQLEIITARNKYDDDILISVTPSTNNRNDKKIPDIPPTLEALVEQSKVTNNVANDNMSTFETMLEEVMKSLEEQDENEYSGQVMKHKGGEIGEIPPERIITSGDTKTTSMQQELTTVSPLPADDATLSDEEVAPPGNRRGFWKKVKVRPVAEGIDTAESQYYHNTVNRFGQPLRQSHEKTNYEKPRIDVTTYKPTFIKDIFSSEDEIANDEFVEQKATTKAEKDDKTTVQETRTEVYTSTGDIDLGTGTPDSSFHGSFSSPTESAKEDIKQFSFMDYLFGVTSEEQAEPVINKTDVTTTTRAVDVEITTEAKHQTESPTESSFIPEEITETAIETTEKLENTTKVEHTVEETTKSEFMKVNALSTAMSTEISHETEICFRGKCIKTSKDIL